MLREKNREATVKAIKQEQQKKGISTTGMSSKESTRIRTLPPVLVRPLLDEQPQGLPRSPEEWKQMKNKFEALCHIGKMEALAREHNRKTKIEEIVVAVLDTDNNGSPCLKDRTIIKGANYVKDNQPPQASASSTCSHGQMMAGLIQKKFESGKIYMERVLSDGTVDTKPIIINSGVFLDCLYTLNTNLAWGIEDAIKQHTRIINLSLGSILDASHPSACSEDTKKVMKANPEILFVTAVGQDNIDFRKTASQYFPANLRLPNKINVGSIDTNGNIYPDMNLGLDDIVAPGLQKVVSPVKNGETIGRGTSGAAALVSRVCKKLLEIDPRLTPHEVKTILIKTATKRERNGYHYKILNAKAAVEAVFHRLKENGKKTLPPVPLKDGL
jgi:hypothetical protein